MGSRSLAVEDAKLLHDGSNARHRLGKVRLADLHIGRARHALRRVIEQATDRFLEQAGLVDGERREGATVSVRGPANRHWAVQRARRAAIRREHIGLVERAQAVEQCRMVRRHRQIEGATVLRHGQVDAVVMHSAPCERCRFSPLSWHCVI